jgi:glycosyltransferase involved in cell wall biosynthesis
MLITSLVQGGGAESQVVRLSIELKSRGYNVSVVSLVKPVAHVDELQQANIQVHSLHMKPGVPDFRAVLALRNIIRGFRPDVVHCHMFHANLLGRVTRLFCHVPVLICTAHSVRENSRKGGPSWHREMLYRVTNRIADHTTTICHAGYMRYVSVGAVSREKFTVIPNGVDTNRFSGWSGIRSKARRELGVKETFAWLAVGRLVVQKDYPTLLKALELMPDENVTLLIAGCGPLEQSLRHQCAERHLDRKVQFCGERKDMLDLYNAADGFVMSSQTEGLPMAVLEAAAMGLPSVVTNVGGIPEIVIDGVAGHLVPPGNCHELASALQRVMHASPELRETMGRAARQHCRANYGMERIVQKWVDLYGECYSSAQAGRDALSNLELSSD